MSRDSFDADWLDTWAADITLQLQSVLSSFDIYYPFPPGRNEVILAAPSPSSLDALRAQPDLITFYAVISEVVMSDIGNAFFVHPPDDVITHLADGPVRLSDGNTGAIFASNGGGILYAIGPGNRVHSSQAASSDSDFEPVASDLRGFLDDVRDTVAHFAATRNPGDLF
jgi:hypothetical protein